MDKTGKTGAEVVAGFRRIGTVYEPAGNERTDGLGILP